MAQQSVKSGMIGILIEAFKEISAQHRALGLRIKTLEQGRAIEPMASGTEV